MKTVYSFLFVVMIFSFALADDTTTPTPPKAEEALKPSEEKPKDDPINVWQQMFKMGEKTAETMVDTGKKVVETVMGIKPEQKSVADSLQGFFG